MSERKLWVRVEAEQYSRLVAERDALRDLVSNLEASCAELRQERDELRADRDALAFAITEHRQPAHARSDQEYVLRRAIADCDLYEVLEAVSSRPSHPREVGELGSPTGAVPSRPVPAGAAPSTSDEGAA